MNRRSNWTGPAPGSAVSLVILRVLKAAMLAMLSTCAVVTAAPANRSVATGSGDPQDPDGFSPEVVTRVAMDRVQIDGRNASLWELSTGLTPEQAATLIESRWRSSSSATVWRVERAAWVIVSRRDHDDFEAAQFQFQAGRTIGYLSRWNAAHAPVAQTPRPLSGLKGLVQAGPSVVSREGGNRVTTLVASSSEPTARLLELIESAARGEGLRRAVIAPSGFANSTNLNPTPNTRSGTELGRQIDTNARASGDSAAARNVSVARFIGRGREWVVTLDRDRDLTAIVFHLMEGVR